MSVNKADITHRQLCLIGAKYMRSHGTYPYHKAKYVVCELERAGECPDVFGFGGTKTQMIEVKVSRSDFMSDNKKYWRQNPSYGIGQMRSYLCPVGLISVCELPAKWGLLYINSKNKIEIIKEPELQESNITEEMNIAASILRRESIKPQVFSYKKYKGE